MRGRADRALPRAAASLGYGHGRNGNRVLGSLALACALAAGCRQDDVFVATLHLAGDGGLGGAGEPAAATGGAGDVPAENGGAAGTAGTGGQAAPTSCDEVAWWFWPALGIVTRQCRIDDDDLDAQLIAALVWFQDNVRVEPSGEERGFEACDLFRTWFYEEKTESGTRYIVCPSKCAWLTETVREMSEKRLSCMGDAGIGP